MTCLQFVPSKYKGLEKLCCSTKVEPYYCSMNLPRSYSFGVNESYSGLTVSILESMKSHLTMKLKWLYGFGFKDLIIVATIFYRILQMDMFGWKICLGSVFFLNKHWLNNEIMKRHEKESQEKQSSKARVLHVLFYTGALPFLFRGYFWSSSELINTSIHKKDF
jgi:hypothetical protein